MADDVPKEKPDSGEDEILKLLKSGFDTEHTLNRKVSAEDPDPGQAG